MQEAGGLFLNCLCDRGSIKHEAWIFSSLLNQNNITVKQAMTPGGKWNAAGFKVVSVH